MQVINFYMCLLQQRDEELVQAFPTRKPSYFFNSFFIQSLLINDGKYNYANIRRWTRKVDVFQQDKIFFPINISNMHWTLIVVFMSAKEIHYYDSMSGNGEKYLQGLKKWLEDESLDKKKVAYDTSDWTLHQQEKHIPQQTNGVDCGMFSLICSDFLSDDLITLNYHQRDMLAFREKVGIAIIRGQLTYPLLSTR